MLLSTFSSLVKKVLYKIWPICTKKNRVTKISTVSSDTSTILPVDCFFFFRRGAGERCPLVWRGA